MDALEIERFGNYFGNVLTSLETATMQPVMEEAYKKVTDDHAHNFASGTSPNGESWPARKPRKDDDGHPLLLDTLRLSQAASGGGAGHVKEVGDRSMTTGVDKSVDLGGIPGAAVHEYGWPEKNIPARPWLGAREDTLSQIGEDIADFGLRWF